MTLPPSTPPAHKQPPPSGFKWTISNASSCVQSCPELPGRTDRPSWLMAFPHTTVSAQDAFKPIGRHSTNSDELCNTWDHLRAIISPPISQKALSLTPSRQLEFNDCILFFKLFIYLLTVLGLCCCVRAFSSCGEQGRLCNGAWASHHGGFSCWGAQALGVGSVVSCARVRFFMWDLPGPRMELLSPALTGGFFTTEPPGKSSMTIF